MLSFDAHTYFQAFEKCLAGANFNLSFESLTSHEALLLLRDVQKNNLELWCKITTLQFKDDKNDDAADGELDADGDDTIEDELGVPFEVLLEWMKSDGKV